MKIVLVAVGMCFVSVINAAAQFTAPAPGGATSPVHYDGNVGIGTAGANPNAQLQVVGDI